MSRFSGTLSSLLASGVPLLQALDTVSSTIDNVIIEKEIMKIEDRVRRGETLSKPMEEYKSFTSNGSSNDSSWGRDRRT